MLVLIVIVVNGENAALIAPKFSEPNDRARQALFDDILDEISATNGKESKKNSESELFSPLTKLLFGSKKKKLQSVGGSLNDINMNNVKSSKFVQGGPKSSTLPNPPPNPKTSRRASIPRTPFEHQISNNRISSVKMADVPTWTESSPLGSI
jgi:hypothetical protein